MSRVVQLNFFAAIPARAMSDDRLTGLHFRVLAVIAAHDRMRRNGQCCWASRERLASRVNCNPSRFSTAVSDLVAWGYLVEERSEEDKRRKGFHVAYDVKADADAMGVEIKEDRLLDRNMNPDNRLPDRNPNSHNQRRGSPETRGFSGSRHKPNIFCETEDITRKRGLGEEDVRRRPAYGAATHSSLAKALGDGGWTVLQRLPDDTLKWLERRCSDGALTPADLLEARQAATAA